MRSTPFRRLLPALLCLPLLSTACATSSTPASLRRGERPTLPTLSPDYVATERLAPLTAKPTGQLMTIDRGIFAELVDRLAEAAGIIERDQIRKQGVKRERGCIATIFETGTRPAGC